MLRLPGGRDVMTFSAPIQTHTGSRAFAIGPDATLSPAQTVCCLSLVRHWNRFKKYNIGLVAAGKEGEKKCKAPSGAEEG